MIAMVLILLMQAVHLAPYEPWEYWKTIPPGHRILVYQATIATAASDRTTRLLMRRTWAESRFSPDAESPAGACGACQIMPRQWRVSCDRMKSDPVAHALKCIEVLDLYVERCGSDWQCCYTRGIRGCRRWQKHAEMAGAARMLTTMEQ